MTISCISNDIFRPGGPYSTKYRCVIENLSHNNDWKVSFEYIFYKWCKKNMIGTKIKIHIFKDLKDMFTGTTYADAHKKREGEGWVFIFLNKLLLNTFRIIHFETYEDLKRAIKEYDGKEVEGKRIRLIDDTDR